MSENRFENDGEGDRNWGREEVEQERKYKHKKESAEEIRHHARSMISIGTFGLFFAGIVLVLAFVPSFPSQYDLFVSVFGGSLTVAIALFVVYRRRAVSSLKKSKVE